MTPYHLHAVAAAWSLHTARSRLAELTRSETARNTSSLLDAAPVLSSTVMGVRYGVGGHGDPVSATLTAAQRPARVTTWADLLHRSDGRLSWICGQLPSPVTMADYIGHILARLPALQPGTARIVWQHLAEEDAWVRAAIGQERHARELPGVDCPACRVRALSVQTAGPVEAWTVVCAGSWSDGAHNPCLCVGHGCLCGMPSAVEGVAHIWPRAVVLGTVGDAR